VSRAKTETKYRHCRIIDIADNVNLNPDIQYYRLKADIQMTHHYEATPPKHVDWKLTKVHKIIPKYAYNSLIG